MRREGGRVGEKCQCARDTLTSCLSHARNWETQPATQACALTGNQPVTFLLTGQHSIHWATPAMVSLLLTQSNLLRGGKVCVFVCTYVCLYVYTSVYIHIHAYIYIITVRSRKSPRFHPNYQWISYPKKLSWMQWEDPRLLRGKDFMIHGTASNMSLIFTLVLFVPQASHIPSLCPEVLSSLSFTDHKSTLHLREKHYTYLPRQCSIQTSLVKQKENL